jgi:hypothetical protein
LYQEQGERLGTLIAAVRHLIPTRHRDEQMFGGLDETLLVRGRELGEAQRVLRHAFGLEFALLDAQVDQ